MANAPITRARPFRSQSPPTKSATVAFWSVPSSARTAWRAELSGQKRSRSTPFGVSSMTTPGYAARAPPRPGEKPALGAGAVPGDRTIAQRRSRGAVGATCSGAEEAWTLQGRADRSRRRIQRDRNAPTPHLLDLEQARHRRGRDRYGPFGAGAPRVRKRQGSGAESACEGSGTRSQSTRPRRSSATLLATIVKR